MAFDSRAGCLGPKCPKTHWHNPDQTWRARCLRLGPLCRTRLMPFCPLCAAIIRHCRLPRPLRCQTAAHRQPVRRRIYGWQSSDQNRPDRAVDASKTRMRPNRPMRQSRQSRLCLQISPRFQAWDRGLRLTADIIPIRGSIAGASRGLHHRPRCWSGGVSAAPTNAPL